MEDVQLIKLDIDVDKIVDEVEHLNDYEYFRDESPVRSIGQSSVLMERFTKTKEKSAYCHDGRG